MKRELSLLATGLVLGSLAAAGWRHRAATPSAAEATVAAAATRPTPPVVPWVPPTTLDAQDAAARIEAWTAGDLADRNTLRLLLPVLPAEAFAGLAETLLARKGGEARSRFQEVFDVWVERDPGAAARWAGALPDGGPLNGRARRLLREQAGLAWARDNLDGALAWAHALPDAAGEWGAAARIHGQLAERDPHRALELARARGDAAFAVAAGKRIYDGWSLHDPAAALQNLGDLLLNDGGKSFIHLAQDIGKWVKQDPDAALRWVLERDTDDSRGAVSLFHSLAKKDGQAALASALLRVSAAAPRTDLLAYVTNEWIRRDSVGATAWLNRMEDEELRSRIIRRAAGSYSGDSPWDNLDMVVLLPEGSERNDALAGRVASWAKIDPEAALAWLQTHDEPVAAAAAQAVLIGQLARADRPAALARLATLPPGAERRRATRAVAAAWAEASPAEAAAWFAGATATDTESYNHQDWGAVVGPWVKKDVVASRDWIEAQADPGLREEAGTAWFLALINSPVGARERADLVMGVRDEQRRLQGLANLLPGWLVQDPDAARAWLNTSALDPETKAHYLKRLDER